MYDTRIKEQYRDKIKTFFWNDSGSDDMKAIMTMDHMTLIWCPETDLIVDVFNNKLETFKVIDDDDIDIIVEAKNEDYAGRFALHGTYTVTGYESLGEGKPMCLVLRSNTTGMRAKMLPSRLKIVEVRDGEQVE